MNAVKIAAHGKTATLYLPDLSDHISKIISTKKNFYEIDLLEDMYGRVQTGTVVDVGAHIGNHTIWFSKIMGLNVVSLEPYINSFEALSYNVSQNGVSNKVRLLNCGAGARPSHATVCNVPANNTGMAKLKAHPNGSVLIRRLDALKIENCSLLKIDVEGAQLDVIKGALALIDKNRPYIYVEADTKEEKAALDDQMTALGYRHFGTFCRTPTHGYIATEKEAPLKKHKLSVAIMAHPNRASRIPYLLQALDYPTAVVMDTKNDRWETGARSLMAYNQNAEYHLVVQDDAVIPKNFIPILHEALDEVPENSPLALYIGNIRRFTKTIEKSMHSNVSWIRMPGVNWGVGLVIPTKHIPDLVEFGNKRPEPNYDMRISRFYERRKIDCWYPFPSLVDHDSLPSLVPGRGSKRHAWKFIGNSTFPFKPKGDSIRVPITR